MDSNIPSRIQLGNFPQHHGCAVVLLEGKKKQTKKKKYKVFLKRKYILKWYEEILSLGLRVGALELSKFYTSKDDLVNENSFCFPQRL